MPNNGIYAYVARISTVLEKRGLPFIFRYQDVLNFGGAKWLVFGLDMRVVNKPELFLSHPLENHLSMALDGRDVFIVDTSSGIFIVVHSGGKINFPTDLRLRHQIPGIIQIGRNISGNEVSLPWEGVGHILIGGMTGSGKSVLLRNLVTQTIQDEFDLFLIDADEMTFAALDGHGLLSAPIGNITNAEDVVGAAVAEMMNRQMIMKTEFPSVDNYWRVPANEREDFRPMLVAIDEANGLISALGGTKGKLAEGVKQLVWRGRKFGVIVVVAGQTFEKAIVGGMRDQLATKICFRVANGHVARVILGEVGAERLKVPGRALTNRWGLVQTYNVPPFQETFMNLSNASALTTPDRELIKRLAQQFDGKMTFANLSQLGLSRSEADNLRTRFEIMGLCFKDKNDRNSMKLSKRALTLVFDAK